MKKLLMVCILVVLIELISCPVWAIPPCTCVALEPTTVTVERYEVVNFVPQVVGYCYPNNFLFSDDCAEGDVDLVTGVLTAGVITADEICTVTATDLANTLVTCSSDIELIPHPPDNDLDGILDHEDNCYNTPNGWNRGTCASGNVGEICNSNEECGTGGYCSMNQEDTDGDGIGDVCDSSIAQIPTLSEWGMMIFLTIIMGISVVILYRRREI